MGEVLHIIFAGEQGWIVPMVVALLAGTGGAMATGYFTNRGKRFDKVYERLEKVEIKETKCQEDLFDLKQELQGFYLMVDILLQAYPDAEDEIKKIRERMIARKRTRENDGEQHGI